jgi:hypothetical protein
VALGGLLLGTAEASGLLQLFFEMRPAAGVNEDI